MSVVAIYNMKGGVGKSTTAVNLAYLAAASGARTLLWDLDAQAASSFAFRVHPKVEGFGKNSLQEIDTLTEGIKATDYDNLDLLPADFAYRKLDRFLHRLGRPDRDLTEVIQKLGRGYTHVMLDCPPGLSTLSENVFVAADLVLVPTIPTVLSLRTLARIVEHGKGTKVAAFLSMVDKRKALHRHISKWAMQYPEFFLSAQVPYASVVEQMCVRRVPLSLVAPQDAATTAFDTLWCELGARLAEPVQGRSAAFAKSIRDLIAELGGEAEHEVVQKEHPVVEASAGIRLAVPGEEAFESLGLKLPAGTTRLAHIFDTDDGILLRNGYLLQLLEEPGAFAVAVSQGEETQVVKIDARWAADILDGSLSPITVLERRLGRQILPDIGKQPLRRVSWRKRLRRHVGPFNFDKISSPGGKVEYEIEATHESEDALRQLFLQAGIKWQPLTVPQLPAPAIARLAATRG